MHFCQQTIKLLPRSEGFTLLELILATLISTLVVGILSVALTFSMRMWERQQDRKPTEFPMLLELMALQLANFDPTPLPSDLGTPELLFEGDESSLIVATDHSVKGLSGGVPVVARYVYSRDDKKLYYAEIPMDPYHQESLRDFMELKPNKNDQEDTNPTFYPVDVEDFSLQFSKEGEGDYVDSWDEKGKAPKAVLVQWTFEKNSYSRVMMPDLPFPLLDNDITTASSAQEGS